MPEALRSALPVLLPRETLAWGEREARVDCVGAGAVGDTLALAHWLSRAEDEMDALLVGERLPRGEVDGAAEGEAGGLLLMLGEGLEEVQALRVPEVDTLRVSRGDAVPSAREAVALAYEGDTVTLPLPSGVPLREGEGLREGELEGEEEGLSWLTVGAPVRVGSSVSLEVPKMLALPAGVRVPLEEREVEREEREEGERRGVAVVVPEVEGEGVPEAE